MVFWFILSSVLASNGEFIKDFWVNLFCHGQSECKFPIQENSFHMGSLFMHLCLTKGHQREPAWTQMPSHVLYPLSSCSRLKWAEKEEKGKLFFSFPSQIILVSFRGCFYCVCFNPGCPSAKVLLGLGPDTSFVFLKTMYFRANVGWHFLGQF